MERTDAKVGRGGIGRDLRTKNDYLQYRLANLRARNLFVVGSVGCFDVTCTRRINLSVEASVFCYYYGPARVISLVIVIATQTAPRFTSFAR